jgi:hypothetical protein
MTVQPEEHWVSHQCHGNAYCVTWQMSRLPSIAHPHIDPADLSVTRDFGKRRKWTWTFTRACQQALGASQIK